MSEFTFPPAPRPSVAVAGSTVRFPVHRIYCVGRNYADHVREMGADPQRTPPVFFMKPADAVVANGAAVPYPPGTANLHHEIELVIAVGRGGRDIEPQAARAHVFGYAAGNDLTRRDLQHAAKERGQPWDTAKGFDHSAPLAALRPVEHGHVERGRIWLAVNGVLRQESDVGEMLWDVPHMHRRAVAALRAAGRGPDLHRHTGRRGRAAGRGCDRGRHRGPGGAQAHDRSAGAGLER